MTSDVKRMKRPKPPRPFWPPASPSPMFDKARTRPRQLDSVCGGKREFDRVVDRKQILLPLDGPGLVLLARRDDGRKEAAVVHAGAEAVQRLEVLGHGVALVLLEAIARAFQ